MLLIKGQPSDHFIKILLSHEWVENHIHVDLEEVLKVFEDGGVEREHQVVIGALGLFYQAEGSLADFLDEISDRIFLGATKQQLLECIVEHRPIKVRGGKDNTKSIIFLITLKLMNLTVGLLILKVEMSQMEVFMIFLAGHLKGRYDVSCLQYILRAMAASAGVDGDVFRGVGAEWKCDFDDLDHILIILGWHLTV